MISYRRQLFRLAAVLPVVAVSMLHGQDTRPAGDGAPTAHQIVSSMEEHNRQRAAALIEYTSKRNYDLDYRGFPSNKHADMTVSLHLSPGGKDLEVVSESGSGMLRNRVLRPLLDSEREASHGGNRSETALSEANYEFSLVGQEQKDGRDCYVLDVTPKKKNKFLYVGRVWIDRTDYAVVHISAHPAKNPSFWITRVQIEHEYAKFGELWLPIRNLSDSSTRFGGRAVLTIDYGNPQFKPNDAEHNSNQFRGVGNDN